jgi:GNAT superfamily N-acetyltransferase
MIARIWTGAVRQVDGDAYAEYTRETGVAGYMAIPGNRGVWMLRRDVEGRAEFVMFTLWDSLDAPEDDRFLIQRDVRAVHYEVVAATPEDTPGLDRRGIGTRLVAVAETEARAAGTRPLWDKPAEAGWVG